MLSEVVDAEYLQRAAAAGTLSLFRLLLLFLLLMLHSYKEL